MKNTTITLVLIFTSLITLAEDKRGFFKEFGVHIGGGIRSHQFTHSDQTEPVMNIGGYLSISKKLLLVLDYSWMSDEKFNYPNQEKIFSPKKEVSGYSTSVSMGHYISKKTLLTLGIEIGYSELNQTWSTQRGKVGYKLESNDYTELVIGAIFKIRKKWYLKPSFYFPEDLGGTISIGMRF